ncbi:hypothetical protein [Sphingomonas sp. Leaf4]|uniref:hypothetical protein n=1 Tax=Sphingomonas sp. Leaf4 TaxID=2876553 RepID=UPI001E62A6BA|nr:hypothetical protein [Sphingomonas sp. Leaf4]
MARAGRKRKHGKRHPSGQLVRTPARDKGTAELQLQRMRRIGAISEDSTELWLSEGAEKALAGTMPNRAARRQGITEGVPPAPIVDAEESVDPIGRAWLAGLLDGMPDATSNDLRDAGRRFAMLYWRKLPGTSPVSSLYARMVSGLVDELPAGVDREQLIEDADARDERQEAALNRILAALKDAGRDVRKATDEVTLDPFADAGPRWLDWLIAARKDALPALSGAISRQMTLHHLMATMPDTIGAAISKGAPDRIIGIGDWHLFLDQRLLLRWSDAAGHLKHALRGLRIIYHGGRLTIGGACASSIMVAA